MVRTVGTVPTVRYVRFMGPSGPCRLMSGVQVSLASFACKWGPLCMRMHAKHAQHAWIHAWLQVQVYIHRPTLKLHEMDVPKVRAIGPYLRYMQQEKAGIEGTAREVHTGHRPVWTVGKVAAAVNSCSSNYQLQQHVKHAIACNSKLCLHCNALACIVPIGGIMHALACNSLQSKLCIACMLRQGKCASFSGKCKEIALRSKASIHLHASHASGQLWGPQACKASFRPLRHGRDLTAGKVRLWAHRP